MTLHEHLKYLLDPILLFGAFGTMAILSLVFKENRFYRLFEHVFSRPGAGLRPGDRLDDRS